MKAKVQWFKLCVLSFIREIQPSIADMWISPGFKCLLYKVFLHFFYLKNDLF